MIVEVDCSCKVEETKEDTIIAMACADRKVSLSRAVCLPATVKRESFQRLRRLGRRDQASALAMYAVGIYIAVQPVLACLDRIVIDTEYSGHEARIRELLLLYIRPKYPDFEPEQIVFEQVGKHSPAHFRAIRALRGKEPYDVVLNTYRLLAFIV